MIDDPMVQARLEDAIRVSDGAHRAVDVEVDKDARHLAIAARDRALEELKTARELSRNQTARLHYEAALLTAAAAGVTASRTVDAPAPYRTAHAVTPQVSDKRFNATTLGPDGPVF